MLHYRQASLLLLFALQRDCCYQGLHTICLLKLKTAFYYLCLRKGFFVLARSMHLNRCSGSCCGWILQFTKQTRMLFDFDAPEVIPRWISIIEFCVHGLAMAYQVTVLETMPISFCILNTKTWKDIILYGSYLCCFSDRTLHCHIYRFFRVSA